TGGSTIGYTKTLTTAIPKTDGTATVRVTTDQGVYKDIPVRITYKSNQRPSVTTVNQTLDKADKAATIDLTRDVEVIDPEDGSSNAGKANSPFISQIEITDSEG
ncbi:hypothetical protein, partial [Streptococcus suis]